MDKRLSFIDLLCEIGMREFVVCNTCRHACRYACCVHMHKMHNSYMHKMHNSFLCKLAETALPLSGLVI